MSKAWIVFGVASFSFVLVLVACGDSGGGEGGSGGGPGPTGQTTGTGTTGTMTSTAATMATTSSGPLTCPQAVTNIMGMCDLFQQNCPPDETCVVFADDPMNPTMLYSDCSPAGLVGLGQPCASANDCREDLLCIGDVCTYACCPDTNEPCGTGTCNIDAMFDNGLGFIKACGYSQTCELFNPGSCPDGEDCTFEMTGLATCGAPSGANAMDGDPCMYKNDCQDSVICIPTDPQDPMSPSVCRYMCIEGSSAPPGLGGCPSGQACDTMVFDFGFMGVGYCHP